MPFDFYQYISNENTRIPDSVDIVNTNPKLNKTNDFFYCPTGQLAFKRINTIPATKDNLEEVYNYGSITSKNIRFLKNLTQIGTYNNESSLLFCRVPNSVHQGVVCTSQQTNDNLLITSGALSGCTACSLYIPYRNIIAFFHVGWTKSYNESSNEFYTQEKKNADLYRSIKLFLNPRDTHYGEKQLSDDELIIKLQELLANFNYVYIHIYIKSREDVQNFNKAQAFLINNGTNCIIRRYYNSGNMYVSKCGNLYSVHFMEIKQQDEIIYSTIARYNVIITP